MRITIPSAIRTAMGMILSPEDEATGLITDKTRMSGDQAASPRIRGSIASSLVLTTSWQTVAYVDDNEAFDTNTFPDNPGGKKVSIDSPGVFTFRNTSTLNFFLSFRMRLTAAAAIVPQTLIGVILTNLLGADIGSQRFCVEYRIVSDSGTELIRSEITTFESTDTEMYESFNEQLYYSSAGTSVSLQLRVTGTGRTPTVETSSCVLTVL